MSETTDGVKKKKWSRSPQSRLRRITALRALEYQLKTGVKISKTGEGQLPLREKDIERVNKEITILKERI